MDNFRVIERRLEAFIRKFYLNELLKGAILFLAAGLLYFLITVGIEYFLWLNSLGRTILFWLFVATEVFLFLSFIVYPITQLLKLSRGLSKDDASRIIGRHFPEVNDKLLNLLQLKKNSRQSDLLLASIEQKSRELKPVPFTSAVNFKNSLKYLKYAAIPLLIILAIVVSGNVNFFEEGYSRVAHYNKYYEPPAPFSFQIQNENLQVQEGKDLKLLIKTQGRLIPETVSILFNGQKYYLKSTAPGVFEFDFRHLTRDIEFSLSSNEVDSGPYQIEVIEVPKLLNFGMTLDYPSYTGKRDEELNGSGNARVPEGTKIKWKFDTRNTDLVKMATPDSLVQLDNGKESFSYSRKIMKNLPYRLSTANKNISDFEALDFKIEVIKDEYPEIQVQQKADSINPRVKYFKGRISDDYGLRKLQLVYYPENAEDSAKTVNIGFNGKAVDEFLYTFPGQLQLEKGRNYNLVFEVFDNDQVNGSKKRRSEVFSYREKSLEEIEEEKLAQQGESINSLNKSLEEMKEAGEELDEFSRLQKEKEELGYNERRKLDNFLKRQKQQNQLMRNYSEKLKGTFEEEEVKAGNKEFKEELKQRVEKNEERLKENEALLEELKELAEKISREELGDKLEELSKRNQAEQRNLEQLLEWTKKYYVEEKARKLASDLEKMAKEQEKLSEVEEEKNTPEAQENISEKFEEFQEEMNELEKENQELKSPKDLGREEEKEEEIKKDQQDAQQNLQKGDKKKAGQKQKNASQKMQQMSQKMQQMSMMQSAEQLDADIKTLRQILDNLVTFSFEQEDLMNSFKGIDHNNPVYAAKLKNQNVLREHFRHIDDSLYSLALRNPMINEEITRNLTDIEYDIEKSLERLSENEVPQGTASQQYVVTGANNLAYLLSRILGNMQMQANPQMGKGKGGQEFQLPDIIQKQEELEQQMQEGMKNRPGQKPASQGSGERSEEENARLYEIYKQQQELRMKLKEMMEKEGGEKSGNLDKQMERLEEQLLDKGFDPEVLQRMTNLKHELMKFEKARRQQGEDNRRTSRTSEKDFTNPAKDQNLKAKEYFNSTEILNRQILPLRQIYKQKVKEYFDGGKD